jgi:hypothetical protein
VLFLPFKLDDETTFSFPHSHLQSHVGSLFPLGLWYVPERHFTVSRPNLRPVKSISLLITHPPLLAVVAIPSNVVRTARHTFRIGKNEHRLTDDVRYNGGNTPKYPRMQPTPRPS